MTVPSLQLLRLIATLGLGRPVEHPSSFMDAGFGGALLTGEVGEDVKDGEGA